MFERTLEYLSNKSNASAMVYCTLQIEGLHSWPDVPFEEVEYLKHPHRHVFYFRAYSSVNHDNRDQEFIMLKHELEMYLHNMYYNQAFGLCDFGAQSCEMLGKELLNAFDLAAVDVSEDNENGAFVVK